MVRICGRRLNEQGSEADTLVARCTFEARNDAESYLNKLIQLLRPDAGYEREQGYWWVRNKGVVTRYTIQA
jgi:hypothetical protein